MTSQSLRFHEDSKPGMSCRPPPAPVLSPSNYHAVVQALETQVPRPSLFRILSDCNLSPHLKTPVDQRRCMTATDTLFLRHGDRLLLARGFAQLHREHHFFPVMQKPPGDVLTTLLQYQRYASQHTGLGKMELVLGATHSRLHLQRHPAFVDGDGHAWSVLYSASRLLERSGLRRTQISLALRDRPAALEAREIAALFDMPVDFAAGEDALIIDNRALFHDSGSRLSLAMMGAHERRLHRLHPELSWSSSVRALLPMVLGLNGTPLALCASLLATSGRTLQRRVEMEGHGFRDLLHDSRRDPASQLLGLSQLSIEQLANRLGYRQSAQFYRAFRGWFGESPRRLHTIQ